MKKLIMLVLAMVLTVSCLALTACGGGGSSEDLSNSKYVGIWKIAEVSFKDASEELNIDYTLTLNDDGTGTFLAVDENGQEDKSDITWSLTDDGFKTKGGTKLTFTDDGDNITTKMLGVGLTFVKQ